MEENIGGTKRQTSEVTSIFDRQHSQIPFDRLASAAPVRWSSQKSLLDTDLQANLHEQIKSHKLVLGDTDRPQQQSSCKRLLSTRRTIESVLSPIEDITRTRTLSNRSDARSDHSFRTYQTYQDSVVSPLDLSDGNPLDVSDGNADQLNITGGTNCDDTCSEKTEPPVASLPPPPAPPEAPDAPPPQVTERFY